MVETPGQPANLDGVEGDLPGSILREEMRRSSPREKGKPFGGSAVFGGSAEKKTNNLPQRRGNTTSAGPAPLTNQMMD